MAAVEKIIEQFINDGFRLIPNYRIPSTLLWQPDIVFSKGDNIYFVLVRSSNTIPPAYLNRISKTPAGKIIPLIVFAQKLEKEKDEELIHSMGISIAYFVRGKLIGITIKKKKPQGTVKKEIKKKLGAIHIFISSKQDINEREFIKGRLLFLRDSNGYPFFTHLIEYDMFDINELYKHVDEVMAKCDWIVILLEDNFSEVVKYEIQKAIKVLQHDNIIMFVKSTNACHNAWRRELNKVKKLKSIKYLPYNSENDLEVNFCRAVHKRIAQICKKEKVEIYI